MESKNLSSVEKYRDYVARLESSGQPFPANQHGGVNLSKIAEECGFLRQVFHQNKTIAALLNEDSRRLGTELSKPRDTETYLTGRISDIEKAANQLRKQNLKLADENEALRRQVIELNSEIIRLQNTKDEAAESIDQMIQTGRRFTL